MLNDFTLILLSLLLETLPFVVLASLLSGFIESFLPSGFLSRLVGKSHVLSVLLGSCVGLFIPMCECGSVVVARRLIKKGMPASGALSYMLAGPIVSPITILSTYTAYYYYPSMAFYRVFTGALIAILTAIAVNHATNGNPLRKSTFYLEVVSVGKVSVRQRLQHSVVHALDDFMSLYPLLLLGLTLTALFKVLVPVDLLLLLRENAYAGIFLAPILAISLSLCAEADAFVASSLNSVLSFSSQLAFLVIGPMLDIKLFLLYRQTFNAKALFILTTIPTTLAITTAMLLENRI